MGNTNDDQIGSQLAADPNFWDTNIFVQLILQGHSKQIDYLQGLIRQHEQGLIELICPRVVQAELYGILKAGRIKRVKACSHEQIMYLLESFFDLFFDREFMNLAAFSLLHLG